MSPRATRSSTSPSGVARPFTISLIVPSPPTATIARTSWCAAMRLSMPASPGPVVAAPKKGTPSARSRALIPAKRRPPSPELGFTIKKKGRLSLTVRAYRILSRPLPLPLQGGGDDLPRAGPVGGLVAGAHGWDGKGGIAEGREGGAVLAELDALDARRLGERVYERPVHQLGEGPPVYLFEASPEIGDARAVHNCDAEHARPSIQ